MLLLHFGIQESTIKSGDGVDIKCVLFILVVSSKEDMSPCNISGSFFVTWINSVYFCNKFFLIYIFLRLSEMRDL